jgi:hypothetical protein
MPRRLNNGSSFTAAAWLQILAVPIVSGAIIITGFYYTTGARLSEHDAAILDIKKTNASELSDAKKDKDEEARSREKTRNEYLTYQQKTNDILGKLDTRLAVSETKQETANQTLQKIADQLSRIGNIQPSR